MNSPRPSRGKILVRSNGTGGINENDVERRANELASIRGRSPDAVDLNRARRELAGDQLPSTTDDAPAIALTRDPSDPPSDTGRQTPDLEGPDEAEATERLVEEGIEEAQHDQMLEARRSARREDRDRSNR